MKAFQLIDIQDRNLLFGREILLNTLLTDATLGCNVNIVGVRRFGKTCLLKTALKAIKDDDALHVYPLYLDFKSEGIRGTSNIYRYMIGQLVSSLYKDEIYKDDIQIGATLIKNTDEWIEVSEQICDLSVMRLQHLFEKLIMRFSEHTKSTILFMIDEYEYLFMAALDNPEGFMKLRTLSTASLQSGQGVFSFWLSGSRTWDEICTAVPGSGEANTISDTVYVTPLLREDFGKMWNHECELIEDTNISSFIRSQEEFVFKASGGVPFYAKNVIGLKLIHNQTFPNYDCCISYFHEILNGSSFDKERDCLKKITINPRYSKNYNIKLKLKNLGLITMSDDDEYFITIEFLKDYLKSECALNTQINQESTDTTEGTETSNIQDVNLIVNEIKSLRKRINHDWTSRKLWTSQRTDGKNYPPFKATTEDPELFESISKICNDMNDYKAFSGSLYGLYYEGTSKGFNLPWGFSPRIRDKSHETTTSTFAQLVMANRHVFGGHVDYQPSDIPLTAEDVYTHINKGKEPLSSEEFKSAQVTMLSLLKEELQNMLNYLKKQS